MRLITRKASTAGVKLPSSPLDPKCKARPAYHIKGMCNTGCGNVGDHAMHTREQDLPLWEWAVKAMPDITAPPGACGLGCLQGIKTSAPCATPKP